MLNDWKKNYLLFNNALIDKPPAAIINFLYTAVISLLFNKNRFFLSL